MASYMDRIVQRLREAEDDLHQDVEEQQQRWHYQVRRGRVWFDRELQEAHRRLRKGIGSYVVGGGLLPLLTAPIIYSLLVPLVLLDLWVTVYQRVCFPIYGIARVSRRGYFVVDRNKLAYLNGIEKVHCVFCTYANGLVAYVREVAARTEQYLVPDQARPYDRGASRALPHVLRLRRRGGVPAGPARAAPDPPAQPAARRLTPQGSGSAAGQAGRFVASAARKRVRLSPCGDERTQIAGISRDPEAARSLKARSAKEDAMTWAHRCLIVAAAVVSIGLSTSACATSRYTYRDTVRARQDVAHVAFDNGYRDGLTYGRRDAQARRRSAPDRVDRYRNADRGYRRSYGDRRFYQEQYRAGFERGYGEAYGRDGDRDRDRRDDRNR